MIEVGTTVGNYVVRSKIGEGGMGFVFMAEHPLIGRRVAIKVIHPDYARNPEAVSRFFTEAQSVNRIGHPNIVDITDFGQSPDGDCYFIMEFLQGESLATRLRRGRLGPAEAMHVSSQVAEALAASHASGILHRDLKPDNIYLIQRGLEQSFVKVLDFGLAKLTGGDGKVSHKTQMGAVMGTPFYMAPEQCSGRPDIDGRADVYALGIIMFEMLSGNVPFTGEGYGEIIVKHMMQPAPRVASFVDDVPPWLDDGLARCLEKDPNARIQTMAELRDFLIQAAQALGHTPALPMGSSHGVGQGSRPPYVPGSQPGVAGMGSHPGSHPGVGAQPGVGSISTLGMSAGQTGSRTRPPQRKSRALWAALAVVAVAGAVTGILVAQGGDKKTGGDVTTVTPDPDTTTPPVPDTTATDKPEPPAIKLVSVNLESDPTGADVTLAGGTKLGTTPFTWTPQFSSVAVELVFHLPDHEEKRRVVTPDQTQTIVVAMAPVAKPTPTPPPPDDTRTSSRTRTRDRDRTRDRTTKPDTTTTKPDTTTTKPPRPDDDDDILDPTTYKK